MFCQHSKARSEAKNGFFLGGDGSAFTAGAGAEIREVKRETGAGETHLLLRV